MIVKKNNLEEIRKIEKLLKELSDLELKKERVDSELRKLENACEDIESRKRSVETKMIRLEREIENIPNKLNKVSTRVDSISINGEIERRIQNLSDNLDRLVIRRILYPFLGCIVALIVLATVCLFIII